MHEDLDAWQQITFTLSWMHNDDMKLLNNDVIDLLVEPMVKKLLTHAWSSQKMLETFDEEPKPLTHANEAHNY